MWLTHGTTECEGSARITSFAGNGEIGDGGEGLGTTDSELNRPEKVAVDADGNVYVLDAGNHRVRLVTPAGLMRTVAGTGESEEIPFPAYAALFNGRQANRSPLFGASHLAVDSAARSGTTLYVGEFRGTALLRSVSLESGRIETFSFPNTEGTLWALVVDDSGTVYIGDGRGIRMRRPNGAVAVIADSGEYGFDVGGMAVDRFGNIWFTDPANRRVRVLEPVH